MKDELFTVAQAAEYLKVCDKTVRRMIASKELVASKVGSRSWRIRKDDIDAYLNATSTGQEGADTIEKLLKKWAIGISTILALLH